MDFVALVDQVIALLRQRGRVTYSTLKRQFQLDEAALEDVKNELIEGQRLAVDERSNVLVWTGGTAAVPSPPLPTLQDDRVFPSAALLASHSIPEAERRQLTVMFCDLVGSTALSGQLDPEDLREVFRAYQATCAEVIQRFDGYIAQYLGDGLLIYFGYPQAHEDNAQRAVRTGLGIVETMGMLNARLEREQGIRLAVRIGIHTGLVVVGEIGGSGRHEQLAVGETPNIAARLQGLAPPDTVVISEVTARLVQGYFACQDLGPHALRGVAAPLRISRVLYESGAQSRLDAAMVRGLTPLVGREAEVQLLLDCWDQVKDGFGQVILMSGEAGIGKSRLVHVLKDRVGEEAFTRIECRCLPYYQYTAFYPVITHLQRALGWSGEDAPPERLRKLEEALAQHPQSLPEAVPLFAALLSVPLPDRYPPLTLTPQKQKQKTLEALLAWLLTEAAQQPVLLIVEDLHWVDPSTMELLSLVVDQEPTTRLCSLFTFRPEFTPPWMSRAHLTPMTLNRLSPRQAEMMLERVAGGKPLPAEVQGQIVAKTDGVPLAVEELTKMVLESGWLREEDDHYALTGPLPPLAIPATLHDSLMARLDRLAAVKPVAQAGATIGRQFAYKLLQAIAPLDEGTLQEGLRQLVEAELLSQRGLPPQATYLFKHALIQDAAYQSLLKSTRQQYHQRIAQVVTEHFAETAETQPELLAHHYTEAGLLEPAVAYWQKAGQRAVERSAPAEAIAHLTQALQVLAMLPETPARVQHEITLHLAMGVPLQAVKGYAAPEREHVYARAWELCQQAGETPQQFPALFGLCQVYIIGGQLQTAREVAGQLLRLTHYHSDPGLLLEVYRLLGFILVCLGEPAQAHASSAQGLALYDRQQYRAHAFLYGQDPGVSCRSYAAWTLWYLGYPDQARQGSEEALALACELAHPYSQALALYFAAWLQLLCRDVQAAQARVERLVALCTEQGFSFPLALGMIFQGGALAARGQYAASIAQMRQGVAAYRATGATVCMPCWLAWLAEAYGYVGQTADAQHLLLEARTLIDHTKERLWEAEVHRLTGAVLLQHATPDMVQAAACFHQALTLARRQQAKAWELRAAISLARLWQFQGRRADGYTLLATIYGWFTEGFDTVDLQEAKALLDELA